MSAVGPGLDASPTLAAVRGPQSLLRVGCGGFRVTATEPEFTRPGTGLGCGYVFWGCWLSLIVRMAKRQFWSGLSSCRWVHVGR